MYPSRAAEEARHGHRLQRDERIFAEGLAIVRDAQHADALALAERRDQRLLRDELGFQPVGLALRHGDEKIGADADLHPARRTLPDFERAHRRAGGVEPHAVERLVSPVQQLERLLRASRFRGGAEQHREQPPSAAARRCDEAIARRLGMAGLHAVDARVHPQQPVAVHLRDVVVAEFFLRVVLRVLVGKSRTSAAARVYRSWALLYC